MTLQERMVAVYLRQAKMPPEEKDKLRLFLGLLLETFEEEEPWEKELRVADPLAGALIEALDRLGMSPESPEAEKYFGIRSSVLQKLLKGENIRHDSRARILQRVQDAGIAVTADDAQA